MRANTVTKLFKEHALHKDVEAEDREQVEADRRRVRHVAPLHTDYRGAFRRGSAASLSANLGSSPSGRADEHKEHSGDPLCGTVEGLLSSGNRASNAHYDASSGLE